MVLWFYNGGYPLHLPTAGPVPLLHTDPFAPRLQGMPLAAAALGSGCWWSTRATSVPCPALRSPCSHHTLPTGVPSPRCPSTLITTAFSPAPPPGTDPHVRTATLSAGSTAPDRHAACTQRWRDQHQHRHQHQHRQRHRHHPRHQHEHWHQLRSHAHAGGAATAPPEADLRAGAGAGGAVDPARPCTAHIGHSGFPVLTRSFHSFGCSELEASVAHANISTARVVRKHG